MKGNIVDMKATVHTVRHTKTGIGIQERLDTNGHIAIVVQGLPLEPEQQNVLTYLLGIWKYGVQQKKPRKVKSKPAH